MIDALKLKEKRTAAGIAGTLVCQKIGIARSRLSDIERGYVKALPEELARIDVALNELIRVKSVIQKTAAALGWPIGDLR